MILSIHYEQNSPLEHCFLPYPNLSFVFGCYDLFSYILTHMRPICVTPCYRYLLILFGIWYSPRPLFVPRSSFAPISCSPGFSPLNRVCNRINLPSIIAHRRCYITTITTTASIWDPIPPWPGHVTVFLRSSLPRSLGLGR